MEYKEILDSARTCIGPYCKACPVCNGKACGNQVPGPGAKAPGSGFIRNFDAWQKICVNMGVGQARENAEVLDAAARELTTIVGQKVVITRAKKSISAFSTSAMKANTCFCRSDEVAASTSWNESCWR